MKDGGMNGCVMSCKNLFNEDCTYACFTDPIVDTRSDSTFGCMVPCNMLHVGQNGICMCLDAPETS